MSGAAMTIAARAILTRFFGARGGVALRQGNTGSGIVSARLHRLVVAMAVVAAAVALQAIGPWSVVTGALRAFAVRRGAARIDVIAALVRHGQVFAANVADDFDLLLHQSLNGFDVAHLALITERDCDTRFPLAGGPADAMDICLWLHRHVEVNDVCDVGDVNAARRDIGCNQHADMAIREVVQGALAGVLRLVAVEGGGANASHRQTFGNAISTALGAREHDDAFAGIVVENRVQTALLFSRLYNHDFLIDTIDDHSLGRQINAVWVFQKIVSQRADFRRHRCREHGRAALDRDQACDFLDVADEAHVEHAVGFIEHKHVDAREIARPHIDVIEQAAGCRHQHMHATFQSRNLWAFADAAEHDGAADAHVAR